MGERKGKGRRRHSKTVPLQNKGHHSPKKNLITQKPQILKKRENNPTEHHRRQRSLGGTKIPGNMSLLPMYIHKAWHIIFGNMNPEQICNLINIYFKPKGVTLICAPTNGYRIQKQGTNDSRSDDFEKITLAWNTLFEGQRMTFRQKIAYINNVLLDPDYRFYVKD